MIVVTGMHRSGTSLAALVLQAMGADFGPNSEMYAADDWNAHGYLERVDVVDVNSRIITGFDRTTGRAAQVASQLSYLGRSISGSHHVRSRPELSRSITELGRELAGICVKDPRFCLTYGAWSDTTAIDGMILALRHPSASVASLQRRNRIPKELGHQFWRWHMSAIMARIDQDTLVLRQEDLIGDGLEAATERARLWLKDRGVQADGDATSVVDRSLVHHETHDIHMPHATSRLWAQLNEMVSDR